MKRLLLLLIVTLHLSGKEREMPMNYTANVPRKYVVGIAMKTSNQEANCHVLWDRFYKEHVVDKIPGALSKKIFAVYTEYEGDHTKPYTFLIGCEVANLDAIPDGMKGIEIPYAPYAIYKTEGPFPESVLSIWKKSWDPDFPSRTYIADFEVYGEDFHPVHNPSATIYIGVEKLVDVREINPNIHVELPYATPNNFTGKTVYNFTTCLLTKKAAQALDKVQKELELEGLGLLVWDGFRPLSAQWKFWELVPDERYVSDPRKGGLHTRGTAVDLTLVDKTGNPLPMPTPFDEFTEKAHADYQNLPEHLIANRNKLRDVMVRHGFTPLPTEWWHFDFKGWQFYLPVNIDPHPTPGSIYKHYKGNLYQVLSVGVHTETEEEVVVYQALYGEKGIWVRPLNMFLEDVSVNGITQQRFALYKN